MSWKKKNEKKKKHVTFGDKVNSNLEEVKKKKKEDAKISSFPPIEHSDKQRMSNDLAAKNEKKDTIPPKISAQEVSKKNKIEFQDSQQAKPTTTLTTTTTTTTEMKKETKTQLEKADKQSNNHSQKSKFSHIQKDLEVESDNEMEAENDFEKEKKTKKGKRGREEDINSTNLSKRHKSDSFIHDLQNQTTPENENGLT